MSQGSFSVAPIFQGLLARVGGPQLFSRTYQEKTIITHFDEAVSIPFIDPTDWMSGNKTNEGKGEKYDPMKPFLPQFLHLCATAARPWLMHDPRSQDSPWASYDLGMQAAYDTYAGAYSSNVSHSDFCIECQNCSDCLGCVRLQNSLECVQCVDADRLYWCERCEDSFELVGCRDCRDCHDCIGSVGLQHKAYYWFNEQLDQEEYIQRKKGLRLETREGVAQLQELIGQHSVKYPLSAGRRYEAHESEGDDLAYTTRVRGVSLASCVDLDASAGVALAERCSGLLFCQKVEDSCASIFCVEASRIQGGVCLEACSDILLGELLIDCHDCLGCIGLRHTSYAILNHVYDKETYSLLEKRIRAELAHYLSEKGRWPELFPMSASPFSYQHSLAGIFFPTGGTQKSTSNAFPISRQERALHTLLRLPLPIHHPSVRRARRYAVWGSLYLEFGACDWCGADILARSYRSSHKIVCTQCFEQALATDAF